MEQFEKVYDKFVQFSFVMFLFTSGSICLFRNKYTYLGKSFCTTKTYFPGTQLMDGVIKTRSNYFHKSADQNDIKFATFR